MKTLLVFTNMPDQASAEVLAAALVTQVQSARKSDGDE